MHVCGDSGVLLQVLLIFFSFETETLTWCGVYKVGLVGPRDPSPTPPVPG